VFNFLNFIFWQILFWEVAKGTVWVFGGVLILPRFIVFVIGPAEEALKLIFTLHLESQMIPPESVGER
jgi:hypothetical protein